ncbi:MAG: prolipoprotein diacylglyceryl transferase [Bacteroidales bacterium]|nr:prolipoprotein diacylglyceryl transferase [Bacteroidales bacterium]
MLCSITWDVDPQIVSWLPIRWYGLMFAIGFWIGFNIVQRMFKREGAPEKWLPILLLWTVAGTVVGSRLGHVFFYDWDYYSKHLSQIPAIWNGGLASHGGAIGVMAGVLLFSWFTTKRSPLWTFDRLVIPIALVGALIRFGNLMNSEIYGHYTDLPWGFIFVRNGETLPAHPTQIYEALCYLALFGLLMWMYWRTNAPNRPGLIFGVFFTILFTCRFLIEFIKNDQVARESDMFLNIGQQLSIPFILLGLFFVIRAFVRPQKHYVPTKETGIRLDV